MDGVNLALEVGLRLKCRHTNTEATSLEIRIMYKTNRLNISRVTGSVRASIVPLCSYHVLTSSVRDQSTHTLPILICLLNNARTIHHASALWSFIIWLVLVTDITAL